MATDVKQDYLTINKKNYALSDLSELAKKFAQDLFRTVAEYNELYKSYKNNSTLINSHAANLKEEVLKVKLPIAEQESNTNIVIENIRYEGTNLPESVQEFVKDLLKANADKVNIEFRLRQLDAARLLFTSVLEKEITTSTPPEYKV
tara:strand:- start:1769 stop:2209 length:441 start_codon:yes stop_codon:yes gene_type:complete